MESINNPFFDKIILSQEEKQSEKEIHNYIIENVRRIGGKYIEEFEMPKTEEDVKIIESVVSYADKILNKYGRLKRIAVPLENIHLLKPGGVEIYTDGRLITGGHAIDLRSILVDRDSSNLKFSAVLFHEMMHLKSYSALQIVEEKRLDSYRSGISVTSRDGKRVYLENVEEAIIEYLTSEFLELIKDDDKFLPQEDKNQTIKLSKGDELEQLNFAIDMIYEKNQDTFKSRDEVLHLFIDAQVNGNLLRLTKVVEKTFVREQ